MGFVVFKLSSTEFEAREVAGYCTRNANIILLVREAYDELASAGLLPEAPSYSLFQIFTGDKEDLTSRPLGPVNKAYSIPVTNKEHAAPCFAFSKWEELDTRTFDEISAEIDAAGQTNAPIALVYWSGAANYVPDRIKFKCLAQTENMKSLIKCNDFHSWPKDAGASRSRGYISMADQVREHQALIDLIGVGYSARVKYLLHSHRPLLITERKLWDWPMHSLEPNVHYIPVMADYSDLKEKAEWVFLNPKKAKAIAENASKFAKERVTHASAVCKYKDIILQSVS